MTTVAPHELTPMFWLLLFIGDALWFLQRLRTAPIAAVERAMRFSTSSVAADPAEARLMDELQDASFTWMRKS